MKREQKVAPGWTLATWPDGGRAPEVTGPNGRSVRISSDGEHLIVDFATPVDAGVVPVAALRAIMDASREPVRAPGAPEMVNTGDGI